MNQHTVSNTLAARLEHRYPGVRCRVEWSEFKPDDWGGKGHAVWSVLFSCEDRAALIGYGRASEAQFEALAQRVGRGWWFLHTHDGLGNRVSISEQAPPDRPKVYEVRIVIEDYNNNDEKPFTKKLQAETARALKRCLSGKPVGGVS
jgi:hypothetical protein